MTVMDLPRQAVMPASSLYAPWPGPFPVLRISTSVRFEQLMQYLRGDRTLAQLIRFALVGGSSNIAYVLLFFAFHGIGPLVANIGGSVVSTVIANELHRQLTFLAAGRVSWFTAQWEGGGLALVGLGISTAALAAMEVWAPTMSGMMQASAIMTLTATVGGMRFLALRGLVF